MRDASLTIDRLADFRSLLDESTILSICSDYDLENPQDLAAALEVLKLISADVEAEEATGFNPSGFGGNDVAETALSNRGADHGATTRATDADHKSSDAVTTTTEGSRSRSHSQSIFSGASSKTSVAESPGIVHVDIFDNLTDEEKERRLAAMFVCLKPIDIKLTLRKTNGDANLAMDELLNLQLLEQTGQRPKGIDGFYISDDDQPKVKKKGHRKKQAARAAVALKPAATKSADSVATTGDLGRDKAVDTDNINFIAEHFALPVADATSIYQRNKFSLGAAIVATLDNYIASGLQPSSTSPEQRQIEEQEKRIPWIPREYIGPIFDMTATYQAAVEVIDVLASHFKRPAYLKHGVSYTVIASTDHENLTLDTTPGESSSSSSSRPLPATLREASAARSAIAATVKHSYATASSASRRGRSDPLMRQAAAFYAERGRSEAAHYRDAVSAEAELLVDAQSTAGTIDLHGVSVHDGVNIALDRAWRWWNNNSNNKNNGAHEGLKVVTGLGRHNPDGKSRLRINVFKALVADGWKVEVLTGAYLLTGRIR
ncbi:hypothetical protein F4777DRAFT_576550 [Nemania sp. FL0916]|nr:hypothetical protein F4777DRAFT_576550 [Nemania sp. FL0916]